MRKTQSPTTAQDNRCSETLSIYADHLKRFETRLTISTTATKGLAWMLLSSLIYLSLSLGASLVLPILLSPIDFGIYAAGYALVIYLSPFAELGLTSASIQYQNFGQEEMSTAFSLKILAAVVTFVVLLLIAPLGSAFFALASVGVVAVALGSQLLIGVLRFPQETTLNRRLEFRKLAIASAAGTVSLYVVAVVLALSKFAFWSLVAGEVTAAIVSTGVMFAYVRSKPRIRMKGTTSRRLLGFGKDITIVSLLTSLIPVGIGRFVIGGIAGVTGLGYYIVAYGAANVIATFTNALDNVLFPLLSRLYENTPSVNDVTQMVVEYSSWFAFPMIVELVVLAPRIVFLILGYGTNKWAPAIVPLQVLLLAQLATVLTIPFYDSLKASGKSSALSKVYGISAPIYIILLYLGTTLEGIFGAAVAYLIGSLVTLSVCMWYSRLTLSISLGGILQSVSKPAMASVATLISMVSLSTTVGGGLLGTGILALEGMAVYLTLMSVFSKGQFLSRTWWILRTVVSR